MILNLMFWATALTVVSASEDAAAPLAGPQDDVLPPSDPYSAIAFGQAALDALGGEQLLEMAAQHHQDPDELAALLARDSALGVAPGGLLLYSCASDGDEHAHEHVHAHPESDHVAAAGLTGGHTDPDSSNAFSLHSRPGASHKIHLAFRGCT